MQTYDNALDDLFRLGREDKPLERTWGLMHELIICGYNRDDRTRIWHEQLSNTTNHSRSDGGASGSVLHFFRGASQSPITNSQRCGTQVSLRRWLISANFLREKWRNVKSKSTLTRSRSVMAA